MAAVIKDTGISDEHAMAITHGDSKDHRPDVKQVVLELMVSHDGGAPFRRKSCAGNTAETQMFQERAAALLAICQHSPPPRYVAADSTLYTENNATNLQSLGCITRIPHTLTRVSQVITQALRGDMWQR